VDEIKMREALQDKNTPQDVIDYASDAVDALKYTIAKQQTSKSTSSVSVPPLTIETLEKNVQYLKDREKINELEIQLKLQKNNFDKTVKDLQQLIVMLGKQNETLRQDLEQISKHMQQHHDVLSLLNISRQNGALVIKSGEWGAETAISINTHRIIIGNPDGEHIELQL
jgi:vacuolar-type H+-ATPase subunit I/STV1